MNKERLMKVLLAPIVSEKRRGWLTRTSQFVQGDAGCQQAGSTQGALS